MRLHILVEGPAEKAFLENWLPRFLRGHQFRIYPHRGIGRLNNATLDAIPDPKHQGLLDQLPAKIRAWNKTLNPTTDRVLVLVDADKEPCQQRKNRVANAVSHCGPQLVALVRVAVEETEAFFLGDLRAIKAAYPQAKVAKLDSYVPDSICGTWELLQEVVGATSEDKVRWAESIGRVLGTTPLASKGGNLSPSFRHLCAGLAYLAGEIPERDPRLLRGLKQ